MSPPIEGFYEDKQRAAEERWAARGARVGGLAGARREPRRKWGEGTSCDDDIPLLRRAGGVLVSRGERNERGGAVRFSSPRRFVGSVAIGQRTQTVGRRRLTTSDSPRLSASSRAASRARAGGTRSGAGGVGDVSLAMVLSRRRTRVFVGGPPPFSGGVSRRSVAERRVAGLRRQTEASSAAARRVAESALDVAAATLEELEHQTESLGQTARRLDDAAEHVTRGEEALEELHSCCPFFSNTSRPPRRVRSRDTSARPRSTASIVPGRHGPAFAAMTPRDPSPPTSRAWGRTTSRTSPAPWTRSATRANAWARNSIVRRRTSTTSRDARHTSATASIEPTDESEMGRWRASEGVPFLTSRVSD